MHYFQIYFLVFLSFLIYISYSSFISSNSSLNNGYICSGNGFYISGNQNGKFYNHGWHIYGEMSGIWMQPIKLLDSYSFSLYNENNKYLGNNIVSQYIQYPYGNSFDYNYSNWILARNEMIIDSLGISIEFSGFNHFNGYIFIEFYPDLRGGWLSDQLELFDDTDYCFISHNKLISCIDTSYSRYLTIGSNSDDSLSLIHIENKNDTNTSIFNDKNNINNILSNYNSDNKPRIIIGIKIDKYLSNSIKLYISGSIHDTNNSINNIIQIQRKGNYYEQKQISKYNSIKENTKINIPDKNIQKMFEWSKYNINWLYNTFDNMGSGILGGLPEYPMIYGCDTTYSIEGMLTFGMYEESMNSLSLLSKYSLIHNKNGQILHEMTVNNIVYNPGNIQETAHYLMQVKNVYDYTKNITWLLSQYESIYRGVNYLKYKDSDGNFIPEGTGIMEIGSFYIPNIEMIDVAVYTMKAYESVYYIYNEFQNNNIIQDILYSYFDRIDCNKHSKHECEDYGCTWSPITSEEYEYYSLPRNTPWCYFHFWTFNEIQNDNLNNKKEELLTMINTIKQYILSNGWLEDEGYIAEFFATSNDVIPIIQEALNRVINLENRTKMKYILEKKLQKTLEYNNKYPYESNTIKKGWNIFQSWITSIPLEHKIFNDIIANKALENAIKFSNNYGMYVTGIDKPDIDINTSNNLGLYTNAVMTLPTGVQAVAESNYKRSNQVLFYLNKLSDSFSYATPGTLHEMSPQGGCYIQAWNIYSISVPIIKGIFGISLEKPYHVLIEPLFPKNWDYLGISNVLIGPKSYLSLYCNIENNNNNSFNCDIILNSDDKYIIDFKILSQYLSNNYYINDKYITLNNSKITLPYNINNIWKLKSYKSNNNNNEL